MLPPDTLAASIAEAEELIKQGKADAIMPREKVAPDFKTPMTAYRWHSLVAAGYVFSVASTHLILQLSLVSRARIRDDFCFRRKNLPPPPPGPGSSSR